MLLPLIPWSNGSTICVVSGPGPETTHIVLSFVTDVTGEYIAYHKLFEIRFISSCLILMNTWILKSVNPFLYHHRRRCRRHHQATVCNNDNDNDNENDNNNDIIIIIVIINNNNDGDDDDQKTSAVQCENNMQNVHTFRYTIDVKFTTKIK